MWGLPLADSPIVWLQRGAAKVYAIDVGYGQLNWRLRSDPRVVVMGSNERALRGVAAGTNRAGRDRRFVHLAGA